MNNMNLEEAITSYNTIGHRNANYLFNWLHNVYKRIYLPCVDRSHINTLALDKTKLTIFDVLVDDVADNFKIWDRKLLNDLLRLPWDNGEKEIGNDYYKICKDIYMDTFSSIEEYPRFQEFNEIFFFDLRQVLDSMEYSYLVNTNIGTGSTKESLLYVPHGLMVNLHCTMDLMCSPQFDSAELGKLHAVVNIAQNIACIGNLLNTYPREIIEKDISCPIIMMGLEEGMFTYEDLDNDRKGVLKKLKTLEDHFKSLVPKYVEEIQGYKEKIKCFDISVFVESLEFVYQMFLKRDQYWDQS